MVSLWQFRTYFTFVLVCSTAASRDNETTFLRVDGGITEQQAEQQTYANVKCTFYSDVNFTLTYILL